MNIETFINDHKCPYCNSFLYDKDANERAFYCNNCPLIPEFAIYSNSKKCVITFRIDNHIMDLWCPSTITIWQNDGFEIFSKIDLNYDVCQVNPSNVQSILKKLLKLKAFA